MLLWMVPLTGKGGEVLDSLRWRLMVLHHDFFVVRREKRRTKVAV
jgi:hypothetical protein